MGANTSLPKFRSRSQEKIYEPSTVQPTDDDTSAGLTELDSLLSPNSRARLPSLSFYGDSTPSPKPEERSRRLSTLIPSGPPSSIRNLLYLGHFTSQWAERTWEFTIVLLLTSIGPSDMALLLPSTYGLFCALSSLLSLGAVGAYIDRSSRIAAFRTILVWQNFSVAACTAACLALLVMREAYGSKNMPLKSEFFQDPFVSYLLIFVHVMGASAQIASQGSSVSIEKDWVPEIAKDYSDHGWLTQTNVQMRQIDLGCKVIAPVFAGFVVACGGDDMKPACVTMGIFNILTVMVEWTSSKIVYNKVERLESKGSWNEKDEEAGVDSDLSGGGGCISDNVSSVGIYCSYSVGLAGLALAMLYVNVLSYGSIMLAYVTWRGMSPPTIGLTRGISAVIGLLGTIAYKWSASKISLEDTGLWSIMMQAAFLGVSYGSQYVDDNSTSMAMLIFGVCGSRIGLWSFDLSVSQMMQERVPEKDRGAVGGIQTALCSAFEMLSYIMGIIWARPEEFTVIVDLSYGGMLAAAACYWIFWSRS